MEPSNNGAIPTHDQDDRSSLGKTIIGKDEAGNPSNQDCDDKDYILCQQAEICQESTSSDLGVGRKEIVDLSNDKMMIKETKNKNVVPNLLEQARHTNDIVESVEATKLQGLHSLTNNEVEITQQQLAKEAPILTLGNTDGILQSQTSLREHKSGKAVPDEKNRSESDDQNGQNKHGIVDSQRSGTEQLLEKFTTLSSESRSQKLSDTNFEEKVKNPQPNSENKTEANIPLNYVDHIPSKHADGDSSQSTVSSDILKMKKKGEDIKSSSTQNGNVQPSTPLERRELLSSAKELNELATTKAEVTGVLVPNLSKNTVDLSKQPLNEIVDLTESDSALMSEPQPRPPLVVETEKGSTLQTSVNSNNLSKGSLQPNNTAKSIMQEMQSVNNNSNQKSYQSRPKAIIDKKLKVVKPQNYPLYNQQQQLSTAQQQPQHLQPIQVHNPQVHQVSTTLPQQQHHVQTNQQRQHALILHQQAIQHQQALFHQQKLQQQLAWKQHQKQVQLIAEQQKQEADARRQHEKVLKRQQTEATFRTMMLNTPVKFDISIGYTPLGPPNQPELFALFNQLTSAMGYTFRNLALMVLKVRQGGPSSGTQSKVALALSHVYCEQMLADWPRDKVKRAECPSVVYALVLRSAFYSDVIHSSSVCFPHSFSSLVESFYLLRERMVEMPDIHPVLKGYITGTISQPSFTGRLNELEYFQHMCRVYNLFPNGMTILHPKYSFPEESAYDETMTAIEIARESRSMSFRSMVSTSVCDIVDDDIVADDPLCFLVFESLELVQINRHRCLPDHCHLFDDESVSQDEDNLFAVKCKRCYNSQESQRDKSELVLLRNSKECNIGITKLVFLHLPNFLSGHRLYKFEMLRRKAKEDNFATFAKSLRRHVASIFRWTQKVLEVMKLSIRPTEDKELWKNVSMAQFRGLLESEGSIEVASIMETGKSNGEPGCAVKECETFPRIGILHGKIEFPTRSDLKFNLRKRKHLDLPEDKTFKGSKVKQIIQLPPVDIVKAKQYFHSSSLVVIEDPHPFSYIENDAFDRVHSIQEIGDSKPQAIIDNQVRTDSLTLNQQSAQVLNTSLPTSTKTKDRKLDDGSIIPSIEPTRDENGKFLRPTGRGFKGMNWDDVRGLWIPATNGESQTINDRTI